MQEKVRCKIDTAVFERVNNIVAHFSRSIFDIQTHIDQYLKDASEDFARQLEAIAQRLTEAEEEEQRAKEEKASAKILWDKAILARDSAESAFKEADSDFNTAQCEYNQARTDQDIAFQLWQEAKEEQQSAYEDMRNHDISHDEFVDYQSDTAEKRDEFNRLKEIFNEKKTALEEAKRLRGIAKSNLKTAEKQEIQAEKAFHAAEARYDTAVKVRKMRVANLKEAKQLVLDYEIYKDNYYHPYYFEHDMSCHVILTQLRTDRIKEFGKAMEEIEIAVNNILRCSLKEGVEYDAIPNMSPSVHQKTWEEDHRIREGLRDNEMQLNHELKRPVDEKPNYAERCKGCGRLISLCNCPSKDEPLI